MSSSLRATLPRSLPTTVPEPVRTLMPIKGHLVDLAGQGGGQGVVRSAQAATWPTTAHPPSSAPRWSRAAKILASIRSVVADLAVRAGDSVSRRWRWRGQNRRTGIRASAPPTHWPLIGRDIDVWRVGGHRHASQWLCLRTVRGRGDSGSYCRPWRVPMRRVHMTRNALPDAAFAGTLPANSLI